MKRDHELLDEIYKHGYTVTGFCKKCGIDPSTIYDYIKGKKRGFKGGTIYTIAINLDMPYEEIKRICPTRC